MLQISIHDFLLYTYCDIVVAEISRAAVHAAPVPVPVALTCGNCGGFAPLTAGARVAVLGDEVDAVTVRRPVLGN